MATLDTADSASFSRRTRGWVAMLISAGVLLLAVGVLGSGWEPIELPLGLVSLGAAAVALLHPGRRWEEERLEEANSLVLASLITLAGFHFMA
ncbi:hypothetical protein [Halomonas sp. NO4]|uniref:hypothetical protein n=1 Tax=Halomonas sp. NO4 TaxID=2484813 RepID=UPI0013D64033|nr:hypothetical protein [Halomonas sp. NO4]